MLDVFQAYAGSLHESSSKSAVNSGSLWSRRFPYHGVIVNGGWDLVERHQIGVPAVDRLARNASSEQRAVQIDDALESVAARGAAKSPAWTLLTDASR